MKSETDWLKCFKANLQDKLKDSKIDLGNIIVWELSWINARLDALVGEGVK